MTTLRNYGEVAYQRQGDIIRDLAMPQKTIQAEADAIADAVFKRLRGND